MHGGLQSSHWPLCTSGCHKLVMADFGLLLPHGDWGQPLGMLPLSSYYLISFQTGWNLPSFVPVAQESLLCSQGPKAYLKHLVTSCLPVAISWWGWNPKWRTSLRKTACFLPTHSTPLVRVWILLHTNPQVLLHQAKRKLFYKLLLGRAPPVAGVDPQASTTHHAS